MAALTVGEEAHVDKMIAGLKLGGKLKRAPPSEGRRYLHVAWTIVESMTCGLFEDGPGSLDFAEEVKKAAKESAPLMEKYGLSSSRAANADYRRLYEYIEYALWYTVRRSVCLLPARARVAPVCLLPARARQAELPPTRAQGHTGTGIPGFRPHEMSFEEFKAENARRRPPGVDAGHLTPDGLLEWESKDLVYAHERPWKYLWVEEREAAAAIGYNESTWDAHLEENGGSGVTALFKKFASLSLEQQRAACVLALDEEAWDFEVVHRRAWRYGEIRDRLEKGSLAYEMHRRFDGVCSCPFVDRWCCVYGVPGSHK